jgi:hypothetical protein
VNAKIQVISEQAAMMDAMSGKKGVKELDRQISITTVSIPLVKSTVLPNLRCGKPIVLPIT